MYDKLNNVLPEYLLNLIKISLEGNFIVNPYNNERINITRCLPQGNKISPLCFNLFINDLMNEFNSEERNDILLYAGDIVIFTKNIEKMQYYLKIISDYFINNCISINEKKTYILCSNHYNNIDITINNIIINKLKKVKYLGIMFNSKGIDLQENINMVRENTTLRVYILKKSFKKYKIIRPTVMLKLVKIYGLNYIHYIWPVLASSKIGLLHLKIMNNFVFKLIFNLPQRTPSDLIGGVFLTEKIEDKINRLVNNFKRRISIQDDSLIKNVLNQKCIKNLQLFSSNMNNNNMIENDKVYFFKKTQISYYNEELYRKLKVNKVNDEMLLEILEDIRSIYKKDKKQEDQ